LTFAITHLSNYECCCCCYVDDDDDADARRLPSCVTTIALQFVQPTVQYYDHYMCISTDVALNLTAAVTTASAPTHPISVW